MMSRPARSDAHLLPKEAAKVEAETRDYFEGIAPKRHTKPSPSDSSAVYSDAFHSSNPDSITEFNKLRYLEADPLKLVCDGQEVEEEYVETEYYKDLNGIDKEHHTLERVGRSCLYWVSYNPYMPSRMILCC